MKRLLLFVFAGLFLGTGLCHGQTVLSAQDAVAYALSHRPEVRAASDRVTASQRLRSQAFPRRRETRLPVLRTYDVSSASSCIAKRGPDIWCGFNFGGRAIFAPRLRAG